MTFACWMECDLGHMWSPGDTHCPVCKQPGWMCNERVKGSDGHQERAVVIKRVVDLEAEIRQLRQVIASQARHHKMHHPECLGLPDDADAQAV